MYNIYLYINALQYAWRKYRSGELREIRLSLFNLYILQNKGSWKFLIDFDGIDSKVGFNIQRELPDVYHANYYASDEGTLDQGNRTLTQRLKEDMDAETLARGGVFFICPICFDKKSDPDDKYMKYCCGQIICKACWHSNEEECRRKSRKLTCEFCRCIVLGPKGMRQLLIDHGE